MTPQESPSDPGPGRAIGQSSLQTRLEAHLDWLASVETGLWAVLAIIMLGDVLLTAHGLTLGLSEANPLAAAVLEAHGIAGLTVVKGLVFGGGVVGARHLPARTRGIVPLGLLLPTLAAVVVNLILIMAVGPV